jgi:leader peptidase (prepilin peptidase)/N-methyltransferase
MDPWIYHALFAFWVLMVFYLGAAVGSFLNVCAHRLPYEKSILWPGSHCSQCLQPIRLADNIPLVSYWLLGGRCRRCGAPFSFRYFLIELVTGLLFAGLFYAEIGCNILQLDYLKREELRLAYGVIPPAAWAIFLHHAVLLSFLILVSLCDLADMEIPLPITITGTVVGLIGSALFPWPWPSSFVTTASLRGQIPLLPAGVYAWPVWYPLPSWMPAGSWQLGLATGLAGAAAGSLVLRGVRLLFGWGRGLEGMGFGDADLMMMAGAFVGWQVVVVGFFAAVFPGLVFGIITLMRRGNQHLPFGPSLAAGVLMALLAWPWLARDLRLLFFEPLFLGLVGGGGAVMFLALCFLLRLVRGNDAGPTGPPDPADLKVRSGQ